MSKLYLSLSSKARIWQVSLNILLLIKESIFYLLLYSQPEIFIVESGKFGGFPAISAGKESTCNAGGLGSIPGLRRSPGEGNGYRLQYSGPENSMDWGCKSGTQLSNFYFHTVSLCQLPILNIAVCNVSIPDSLTIPPPILPPVTTSLFSKESLYIPLPFYFFPFPYNYFKPGMYCSPPCFTMYTQFSLI